MASSIGTSSVTKPRIIGTCGAIPELSDKESIVFSGGSTIAASQRGPNMAAATTNNNVVPPKLECDYDVNPTVLYQAIEARQWDYAAGLFKGADIAKQAATWVSRKETTGKLRWRLLPIHAAIIFGAPIHIIELLLSEFSAGAQCKDDQGMLPIHLAFRHEAAWEIIEELLTSYPEGITVKDRKSRTPIMCGTLTPSSVPSSGSSVTSQVSTGPQHSKGFKSVVSLIELYAQVAVTAERQRAVGESRTVLEKQVGKLQDSHLQTLTLLKKEWQSQQEESKSRLLTLEKENESLKKRLAAQDSSMSVQEGTQKDLTEKLRQVTNALQVANLKNSQGGTDRLNHFQNTNKSLRMLIQDLVSEQKEYHIQFEDLMKKYEKLSEDRQRVLAVFGKQTTLQAEKEGLVIKNFKSWMGHRMKKLEQNEVNMHEEKKVEEVMDYVTKTTGITGPSFTPTSAGAMNSPTKIHHAPVIPVTGGGAKTTLPAHLSPSNKAALEVTTIDERGEALDVIDLSRIAASPKMEP